MASHSQHEADENLQIAFEAAHFLESQIPEAITSEFDYDMTFDVGPDNTPLIIVTVNEAASVNPLSKKFGDAVLFHQAGAKPVNIPIIVRQFRPSHKMN